MGAKMARSRNIKPDFFKNEELAACPPLARILFSALWCLADREGRLEDRPRRIKIDALPYDDCDCDELLTILHKGKFIVRYTVNGERYIQVVNFKKHQNPHVKENPSVIPECPVQDWCAVQPKPEQAGLIPLTLNLIPVTVNRKPESGATPNGDGSVGGVIEISEETWNAIKPRCNELLPLVKPGKGGKPKEDCELIVKAVAFVEMRLMPEAALADAIQALKDERAKGTVTKPGALLWKVICCRCKEADIPIHKLMLRAVIPKDAAMAIERMSRAPPQGVSA